jgi:hypothetical protein
MITILSAINEGYDELSQKTSDKYSFLTKLDENTYRELFYPVKCRDYLNDIIIANYHGYSKVINIYDFNYNGGADFDTLRLSVSFDFEYDKELFVNQFSRVIKYIENNIPQIENKMRIITDVDDTNGDYHRVILEGDKFWMSHHLKINILTFVCRLCSYHHDKKYRSLNNIIKYLYNSLGNCNYRVMLEEILKSKINLIHLLNSIDKFSDNDLIKSLVDECEMEGSDYDTQTVLETIHNNLGVISFLKIYNRFKSYAINDYEDAPNQEYVIDYINILENE